MLRESRSFPTPRRSSAPTRSRGKSRRVLAQDARRRTHHQRRRLQPAQLRARPRYNGFFFVTLKEWGDRTTARRAVPGDQAAREPGAAQASGRDRLQLLAAGDSRRRHLRRIHLRARGPLGQGRRVPRRQPEHVHGRRAQAAGDRRREHHLPAERAAAVRRRRSRQGAQAGRAAQRRLPDDPGLHGRLLRQLLQPLRPPVAGLRRRPKASTARKAENVGQFYVRNNERRAWCRSPR